MAAADITLVHAGIGAVADVVMLARATRTIIRQNLGWAFGYNLILVPLAAAGVLPPVLAAMAASSVTVVGNALRLRRSARPGRAGGRPPRRSAASPRVPGTRAKEPAGEPARIGLTWPAVVCVWCGGHRLPGRTSGKAVEAPVLGFPGSGT